MTTNPITQLTDSDLNTIIQQAKRLSTDKIFSMEADTSQAHGKQTHPSDFLNAWLMALRLEQAHRAGKFYAGAEALLIFWPQITRYRDNLIETGLNAQVIVGDVAHAVNVTISIGGD